VSLAWAVPFGPVTTLAVPKEPPHGPVYPELAVKFRITVTPAMGWPVVPFATPIVTVVDPPGKTLVGAGLTDRFTNVDVSDA